VSTNKPGTLKEKIYNHLVDRDFTNILLMKEKPEKVIRILFGFLYNEVHSSRVATAYVMGLITKKIFVKNKVYINHLLQKLLWSLNDESGFVCWGAPEAIGEIVRNIPELIPIYAQFLISFLSHPHVILNNDLLEIGALIALSRIGRIDGNLKKQLSQIILQYLEGEKKEIKEFAFWCGYMNCIKEVVCISDKYFKPDTVIKIYEDGCEIEKSVSEFLVRS
jgi:hypothetical protein